MGAMNGARNELTAGRKSWARSVCCAAASVPILGIALTACSAPMPTTDVTDTDAWVSDAGVTDVSDSSNLDASDARDGAPDATDASRDAPPEDALTYPDGPVRLSETGLYADISTGTLAAGVARFTPRFELWSDGAEKTRYLLLPPGTRIDTSDMDNWVFPIGTRVWKEFRMAGRRIETRLIQRVGEGPGGWFHVAYEWNDTETDAVAVPAGRDAARGTALRIPSQVECRRCHEGVRDFVIGVSAIQLTSVSAPSGLADFIARGWLTNPPASEPVVPGDDVERAALGYLHGNCGHCHNETLTLTGVQSLHARLSVLDTDVRSTSTYVTSIGIPARHSPLLGTDTIVVPGAPARSQLWVRMGVRDPDSMPPVGTLRVDDVGRETVRRWIAALPPM